LGEIAVEKKVHDSQEFAVIPLREKIAYFVGECGSCGMFYYLTITLSTYFFTDVMHISALTLGTIIIVSRIFDGLSDLIVGSLVDRTHSRWGKARPWVLFSTVPYAVAMVLLYCIPASFTTGHQIAYIIITYNLAVTVCYTVENIPWGSLPALMTRDKVQRSQMHSIRMLASPLGSAIGVSAALPLIRAMGGRQQDWIKVMTILALVGIACNFFAIFTIKERVTAESTSSGQKRNNRLDIPSALRNPYWWAAITITLVWNTFSVATATLTPYYTKYFLLNDQITASINNAQAITMALAAFSCYWLTKKMEKSTILKITMVISLIGQIILIGNSLNLPILLAATVVRSIGFGCMGACMFAMATDAIEYGQWFTGHRAESTTYSAVGIGNKLGVLLGSGILTILLGSAGYNGTLTVQSASAMHMIGFLYLWTPVILAGLTIVIMFCYKLDKRYDAVLSDLDRGIYHKGAPYAPPSGDGGQAPRPSR
jgi:GPH family glycoside/pentoside/hexuronide:cation symporter